MSRGHSAAADAFSIAAAPANLPYGSLLEPGDPPNPRGPFPEVFTVSPAAGALHLRRSAADFLRRRRHARAAAPPEAGDHRGRRRRHVGRRGSRAFFGTSASAPHAAAIAGLVLSGNPAATETELREAFEAPRSTSSRPASTTAPATASSAPTACSSTRARRRSRSSARSSRGRRVTGDGDANLEPGETRRCALPVTNVGDGTATGISVDRDDDDPLRSLTPRTALRRPAGGREHLRDFTLALDDGLPARQARPARVRVTFAGVLSPTNATFTVTTGQPGRRRRPRFAYTGPPVPIPDASTPGRR